MTKLTEEELEQYPPGTSWHWITNSQHIVWVVSELSVLLAATHRDDDGLSVRPSAISLGKIAAENDRGRGGFIFPDWVSVPEEPITARTKTIQFLQSLKVTGQGNADAPPNYVFRKLGLDKVGITAQDVVDVLGELKL